MKYRLGLDVGTASVGLVAYELDGRGQPVDVLYHSVRIFKQAARREHRQQMRQHQRSARRLRKLAHLAPSLLGVAPEAVARRRKPHILEVRARAATEKVALEDLLRIFLHLSKRRGYAGTFRVKKSGDTGKVQKGIGELQKDMNEAGCETLGEYLWRRHQQGQPVRLKAYGLYAGREMIRSEFGQIWATQEKEHEQLGGAHEGRPLREIFEGAIFHQRPIRIPRAGNCSLETSLPRSPQVQPAFQEFRIEKQIADLRWAKKGRRHPKPLEEPAKQVIRKLLSEREKVKFEQIYEALEKQGIPVASGEYLNLSSGDREDLRGNGTNACMKRLGLEQEWQNLSDRHRITALNLLADEGSPDIFDKKKNWHETIARGKQRADRTPEYRCIPREVVKFVNSMIDTGEFDWISKMGFDSGRSAYSIKALRRLTAVMREKNLDEADAKNLLYPQTAKTAKRGGLLRELPPHKHTGNVVVDVSLRQVRREVNAAIRKLGGPPDSMVIELFRDMPAGAKRREEIAERNKKNQKAKKRAAREIKEKTGNVASEKAIARHLLWTEQDRKWCPYCTKEDISIFDALDGSKTELDHIFPKSITRIGKRRNYLVLAHRSCNQEKGAQNPREKWGDNPERWKVIQERAKQYGKKRRLGKKRQLLSKESGDALLDSKEIGDFSDRQFHDSSWISEICARWMKVICSYVEVSRGILTASLRRKWGLDTVIPEVRLEEELPILDRDDQLITREEFERHRAFWEERGEEGDSSKTSRKIEKRIDHRHHLVDAMVLGLTSRSLYQKMARAYKREAEKAGASVNKRKIPLRAEPPIRHIRELALDLVRNCNLTHRRDHWPGGPFFKEQPLAVVKIDKQDWFAQRKTLSEIAKKPQGANLESWIQTVRGRIGRIEPLSTRETVEKAFGERIEAGMNPNEALAEESEGILDRNFKNRIRRVRIRAREKADEAILVEHHGKFQNRPFEKYMKTDGYICLELDMQQGGARLVTLHEAMKSGRLEAPKGVRFFKGDTVLNTSDKKRYVVRQIKAAKGGSLVLIRHTETREAKHMDSASGKKSVSGKALLELTLIPDVWPPHSSE